MLGGGFVRVNVDSAIFGDARLKLLARYLGIPWTQALGALVAVWHHCYQKRQAVVTCIEVDAVADIDALAVALEKADLASRAGQGKVRVHGVAERIEWLDVQSNKAKSAAKARWQRASQTDAPSNARRMPDALQPHCGPDALGVPYSPSPSPSPALEIPTHARRPHVERVVTSAAAELATYFFEAIRSHSPTFEPATTIQQWAVEFDVGLRAAGGTVEGYCEAIDYAHKSDETFWRGNILSVKKLRKQLQTLLVQARQRKSNGKPRQVSLEEAGIRDGDELLRQRRAAANGGNP